MKSVLFDETGYFDFLPDCIISEILCFCNPEYSTVFSKLVEINHHLPDRIKEKLFGKDRFIVNFDDLERLSNLFFTSIHRQRAIKSMKTEILIFF